MLRRCPRQWFYKAVFAKSHSKDPQRREAYLLSKLQTISGWRGQIVDSVLSNFVVEELNAGRRPTLRAAIARARVLFNEQRTFGLAHRMREPELVPSQVGPAFAAFFKIEYGEAIASSEFDQAWADIERALRIIWRNTGLREKIRRGRRLVAQRNLLFDHFDAKVRAVPDLIVFFNDRPPLIIDWKVHSFGTRDSADQLTTYAIALARTPPHVDFVTSGKRWNTEDIELIEAQLIVDSFRNHPLSGAAVAQAEERIASGISAIQLACGGRDATELTAEDFPTARNPQTCRGCPYRKICWN
jgi:hypothetical protein